VLVDHAGLSRLESMKRPGSILEGSQELAHTCRFGVILVVEFISQLVGYLFLEFTTKLGRVVMFPCTACAGLRAKTGG
jgi:hypothetical protein